MKKTVLVLILLGVLVSAGCSKPLKEKKEFVMTERHEQLIKYYLWLHCNGEKLADIEKHRADK